MSYGNFMRAIHELYRAPLTHKVDIIPGISDHEIIKITSNLSLCVLKPKERKINLWNKANFNGMMQFAFLDHYTIDTPVQDLWDVFKMQRNNCLDLVLSISFPKSVRNSWIKVLN